MGTPSTHCWYSFCRKGVGMNRISGPTSSVSLAESESRTTTTESSIIITFYSTPSSPPSQLGVQAPNALIPLPRFPIGSSSLTNIVGLHTMTIPFPSLCSRTTAGDTTSISSPIWPSSAILSMLSGRMILCVAMSIMRAFAIWCW